MPGLAHIGTSGWIYKHWKDLFYAGVKQKDWLPHYASHFPTVEINNSFYRKPTPEAVRAWPTRVPAHFTFAVKMWRGITHYRKVKDARDLLDKFIPVISELPPAHRGPLLVQLPGNLHRNEERLDAFLTDLHATTVHSPWPIAVEFRSPDWLTDDVYKILDQHHAAVCLADMPACTITRPNNAPHIYIRRHGVAGTYNGAYTDAQIAHDAHQIRTWTTEGREVWIYYNNDIGGHAITDATRLTRALAHP